MICRTCRSEFSLSQPNPAVSLAGEPILNRWDQVVSYKTPTVIRDQPEKCFACFSEGR